MIDYQNLIAITDFRDPSNLIYNSDLVTITEFGAQLKDLVPANVCVGATYSNSSDANYGNGTINLAGSIYGTVNVQNNKLALLGGHYAKSLDYFLADNKNLAQAIPCGQVTFQYYPNYSNLPQTTQNIFHLGDHEIGPKDHIHILHTSTGDIIFKIFDHSGNTLITKKDSVVVETALTPWEFRIAWDSIDAKENDLQQDEARVKLYFYFNGELLDSYDLDASVFDIRSITKLGFGIDIDIKQYPNFYVSDLLVEEFESGREPLNLYEVRSYLPMTETRYTIIPQKVAPKNFVTLEKLKLITTEVNEDSSSSYRWYVGYTFEIDGNEYYFDRSDMTWKLHQEPDQISDLGYMLFHADAFIKQGCRFKCIPYLRSIPGTSTPQITSMTTTYDEFIPYQEVAPVALVFGYVRNVLGKFVQSAKILITPSKASVSKIGNYILPKMTRVVRSGQNGYWDASLPLSINFPDDVLYNFQILIRDEVVYEVANIKITQEGSIKFEDLIAFQNDEDYMNYKPGRPQPPTPGEIPKEIKDEIDEAVDKAVDKEVDKEVDQAVSNINALRYKESLDDD